MSEEQLFKLEEEILEAALNFHRAVYSPKDNTDKFSAEEKLLELIAKYKKELSHRV